MLNPATIPLIAMQSHMASSLLAAGSCIPGFAASPAASSSQQLWQFPSGFLPRLLYLISFLPPTLVAVMPEH